MEDTRHGVPAGGRARIRRTPVSPGQGTSSVLRATVLALANLWTLAVGLIPNGSTKPGSNTTGSTLVWAGSGAELRFYVCCLLILLVAFGWSSLRRQLNERDNE